MNFLSVDKLSKSYGERTLFQEISFGLTQSDRLAIVGVNGCGKSTLLKILAGQESADKGSFSYRNGIKVSFLAQNPSFEEGETAYEAIFNAENEQLRILKNYETLIHKSILNEQEQDQLQQLIHQIDDFQLWDYESQVNTILGQLGISNAMMPVGEMSGGQKKRVALARELVSKPDFLILDEPTNHLDVDTIEWLEKYFTAHNVTILMVTHDRYFLDSVCTGILEIDNQQIYRYEGNYESFLMQKEERESIAQGEVEKAKNLMRKELDWIRRQPKARGTKAKYRVDAFYDLKDKASQNLRKDQVQLEVSGRRLGGKILELDHVNKAFDSKKVLHDFSYTFKKKERIGIVGKNGAGKSSFLNIITGELSPDTGEIEVGQNTHFGYYKQSDLVFDEGQKVIDVVLAVAETFKMADGSEITASQFLNRFLFPPKQQHDFIRKLSGGEKRRLQLLLVLIRNPNFLILDEPTNDLDIVTLNVLEEFLEAFTGCLILVSHDRYFMDKLVDQLFVFEGEGVVRIFNGNYTDYRYLQEEEKEKQQTAQKAKAQEVKVQKQKENHLIRKMSFNEKREFEALEKEIADLQKSIKELEMLLIKGEGSADDFALWGSTLQTAKNQLDAKELRWLELSELQ